MLQKTSEDIYEFINGLWQETKECAIGVNLKVLSTTKSKKILDVKSANAVTKALIHQDDVVTLVVYEEAFDRLSDLHKELLVRGALGNVFFDIENEKLSVNSDPWVELFNMRAAKDAKGQPIGDLYDNAMESAYAAIRQIAEEEAERKQEKKGNKNAKREE